MPVSCFFTFTLEYPQEVSALRSAQGVISGKKSSVDSYSKEDSDEVTGYAFGIRRNAQGEIEGGWTPLSERYYEDMLKRSRGE